MINFDEEIQKFQPSLEVEDAEDAIYNNDVPDITDLITQILNGKNSDKTVFTQSLYSFFTQIGSGSSF